MKFFTNIMHKMGIFHKSLRMFSIVFDDVSAIKIKSINRILNNAYKY